MKRFLFLLCIGLPLVAGTKKKVVSYQNIDSIFKETWDATYPVPFEKIIKKDLIGRGIMILRKKRRRVYLYSFLISLPLYIEKNEQITKIGQGKQVTVRLYYTPSDVEKPYTVRLGEFSERYTRRGVIGYIRK